MTKRPSLAVASRVGRSFGIEGAIEPVAGGHINESFRIEGGGRTLLLQWINPEVFPHPGHVADNVECVLDHLAAEDPEGGWPTLATAADGSRRVQDEHGLWRALSWLPDRVQLERPDSPTTAQVGARAFGHFAALLADLDPAKLKPVLPGFHDLDARLAAFDVALANSTLERREQAKPLLDQVAANCEAHRTPTETGPPRVIHGDTKFTNLLFTADRSSALAVDYDTVMPGALWMDFGDLLRSAASTGAEDDPHGGRIRDDMLRAATQGYRETLTDASAEAPSLAPAPARMAFMLGVRFLTDFLTGDRYFRIHRPNQNLDRAQHQLRLAQELTTRTNTILEQLLFPGETL